MEFCLSFQKLCTNKIIRETQEYWEGLSGHMGTLLGGRKEFFALIECSKKERRKQTSIRTVDRSNLLSVLEGALRMGKTWRYVVLLGRHEYHNLTWTS
jgi:hypothetical protein